MGMFDFVRSIVRAAVDGYESAGDHAPVEADEYVVDEPRDGCEVRVRFEVGEDPEWEMRSARFAEEARRREEEWAQRQRDNRDFLVRNGVDVGIFTAEKGVADVRELLASLCAPLMGFRPSLSDVEPRVTYSDPTKTGRVPKNVASVHMVKDTSMEDFDAGRIGAVSDALSASVDYLADGTVNKADIIRWHDHHGSIVRIRTVRGTRRVTHVETNTGYDGTWKLIYHDLKAEDEELAQEAVRQAARYLSDGTAPTMTGVDL